MSAFEVRIISEDRGIEEWNNREKLEQGECRSGREIREGEGEIGRRGGKKEEG